jgi:hypothetical protein
MARIRQEEADMMRGKAKRLQLATEQITSNDATVEGLRRIASMARNLAYYAKVVEELLLHHIALEKRPPINGKALDAV